MIEEEGGPRVEKSYLIVGIKVWFFGLKRTKLDPHIIIGFTTMCFMDCNSNVYIQILSNQASAGVPEFTHDIISRDIFSIFYKQDSAEVDESRQHPDNKLVIYIGKNVRIVFKIFI